MIRRSAVTTLIALVAAGHALAQPPGRRADSPASQPVPATVADQTYAAELVDRGRGLFGAQLLLLIRIRW